MTAHAPTAKLSLLARSLSAGAAAASCGPAMGPCLIDTGSYHIVVPDGDAQHGAVLLLHGFGSSGEGALRNTGMVRVLLDRGYAVIAPDGQQITGRDGRSWDFLSSSPAKRNDTTFIKAVADDAVARFHLNRDKMLLAGFSLGGSMVSYIACTEPNAFAAFAPVAGSFWEPQPSACAGPRALDAHARLAG
jgi:polyhydroxybutyrate depolymerase